MLKSFVLSLYSRARALLNGSIGPSLASLLKVRIGHLLKLHAVVVTSEVVAYTRQSGMIFIIVDPRTMNGQRLHVRKP